MSRITGSRITDSFFASLRAATIVLTAAAGFVLFMTTSALSQGPPPICSPRDHLLSWLQENFGEEPVGVGVADGSLVELLTSENGMTWTIILTSPNGISCMMTGGEAWRQIPKPQEGPAV